MSAPAIPTFETVSEFRQYAESNPDFVLTHPSKTKLQNPVAFTFRESQQVVFGFSDEQLECVEIRIVNPHFAVTPSTGAVTRFSPNILQRLDQRDKLVSDDLMRSGNVESGAGWFTKPTSHGRHYVFVSIEVSELTANLITELLKNQA